jgi:hypothetical protein
MPATRDTEEPIAGRRHVTATSAQRARAPRHLPLRPRRAPVHRAARPCTAPRARAPRRAPVHRAARQAQFTTYNLSPRANACTVSIAMRSMLADASRVL